MLFLKRFPITHTESACWKYFCKRKNLEWTLSKGSGKILLHQKSHFPLLDPSQFLFQSNAKSFHASFIFSVPFSLLFSSFRTHFSPFLYFLTCLFLVSLSSSFAKKHILSLSLSLDKINVWRELDSYIFRSDQSVTQCWHFIKNRDLIFFIVVTNNRFTFKRLFNLSDES